MELGPGTKVTPNVELVRLLGKGGMGSVWVARHLTLETEVAVKFVIEDKGDSKVRLTRFKREASIAAKITSPHVVRTFDHGVMDNDKPFIVMELLSGETLTQRLRQGEPFSPHSVLMLMSQLAGVLKNAHAAGIVHRDLKPDNLFLLESEYELFLKVLDFGIAKLTQVTDVSVVTESGALIGTPNYMSPEQLLGKEVDHRVDLWAAAVLAYQCITGSLPFEGDTVAALSVAICHDPFEKASALVPGIPDELDAWFDKALQKSPDDRFKDARDMIRALEEATENWVERPMSSALRKSKPTPTLSSDDGSDDSAANAEPQTIGGSSGDEERARRAASGGSKETPTFGGSTSTLDGGGGRVRRWGGIAALTLAAVIAVWLATSNSEGDDAKPTADPAAAASAPAPPESDAPIAAEPSADPSPGASASPAADTPASSASATASVAAKAPAPRAVPRPVARAQPSKPEPLPAPAAPSKTKGKPDYCATHGFIVTKEGHKVPKPECL